MPLEASDHNIYACVSAIQCGECIAYPTEAVWGLGCDPTNLDAIREILRIKQRPPEKGLILVASDMAHIAYLLDGLERSIIDKMKASWPGHTTWLVPHKGSVPNLISGDSDKVAVRVSAHPVVQALCSAYGGALVSTSANPAGLPAALTESEVRHYFQQEPLVYASGKVGNEARASRIIDAHTGDILRD